MRKTLTLSALATGLLFASKGSTQTPPTAYATPLPVQAVPQAYLPPPTPALPMPAQPPRPPEPMAWTATRAEPAKLVTKVFDITEIILQVGTKGTPAAVADRAERLTSLLEGFVEPNSWKCAGGRGSMVFFAENYSLVVNNELRAVAGVETWLDKLRTAAKPEVKVGIDRIRCDSATFAKLGFAGRKAKEPIALSPAQLVEMRKILEADTRFEMLESPRLSLVDNQTGFVQIGQHFAAPGTAAPSATPGQPPALPHVDFVGISYRATPRIMPDGQSILLRLESEQRNATPRQPATACTEAPCPSAAPAINVQSTALTFAVPNGGTVLVPMGVKTVEERVITKVPLLANLPKLDVLFNSERTELRECETFVLVTANTKSATAEPMQVPVHFATNVEAKRPVVAAGISVPVADGGLLSQMVPAPVDPVMAYRKACREGRLDDARRFAAQALAADPKCFETK